MKKYYQDERYKIKAIEETQKAFRNKEFSKNDQRVRFFDLITTMLLPILLALGALTSLIAYLANLPESANIH